MHHNRGFLYGDGFFETMRIVNNDIPLWSFHMARAQHAAQLLEMNWLKDAELSRLKQDILTKNQNNEPIVRLDFYRHHGGTYKPDSNHMETSFAYRGISTTNSAFVLNNNEFQTAINKLPLLHVGIYSAMKKPCNVLSGIKSSAALFYVKAGLYLKAQEDLDDVLILNEHGRICEALSSNILISKDNQWCSVAKSEGPVDGVFQSFLKTLMPIEEGEITISQLRNADEILLTNAASGIRRAKLVG